MCDLTDIEARMDKLGERLARIETGMKNQSKQIDRMILLLDRMVRVEEHVEQHREKCDNVTSRLVSVETELQTWRSVRKFFGIVLGLAGVFSAWLLAWYHDKI